ncbi:unnamed protein product [Meloidogyne enterolobii]
MLSWIRRISRFFYNSVTADLLVTPSNIVHLNAAGENIVISVRNVGNRRYAYKLLCTNNTDYNAANPFGFFVPNTTTNLQIMRNNGPEHQDLLQIIVVQALDNENDPVALLPPGDYGQFVFRIQLDASNSLREQLVASSEPESE